MNKEEFDKLGNRVKALEGKIPPIERKLEEHDERIKYALDRALKAVQWWWPLFIAVAAIVALGVFTVANIFYAILTITAVIIVIIGAIVAYYYFYHKPTQQLQLQSKGR